MADHSPPERVRRRELIGQARNVEGIKRFVESALVRGGALVVSGETGIGKTAMLDLAAGTAASAGALPLRASGVEIEAAVSFALLDSVLAPLRDEINDLPPHYAGALAAALGLRQGTPLGGMVLGNAVLELLHRAAARQPVIVVVDNLQWVDPDSAAILGFVSRRSSCPGIAFVGAVGLGGRPPTALAGLPELVLRPLDEASAELLVTTECPGLSPAARARVVAAAHGNPLALIEISSAQACGRQADDDSVRNLRPAPPVLGRLFAQRLTSLPPQTRALLLLVALESSGELSAIAKAASAAGGVEHLTTAETRGLVSLDASRGSIRFRHRLLRAAVVDAATEIERRRAHRALAEAFHDRPDRRAWHLADAAAGPDAEVADLLEELGRSCLRRGDPSEAVRALTRAADLSPEPSVRGRRLVDAADVSAAMTGRLDVASALLDSAHAVTSAAPDSLRAAITRANIVLGSTGDVYRAHRILVDAISGVDVRESDGNRTLIDALHTLFRICSWGGRAELWETYEEVVTAVPSAPPELVTTWFRGTPGPSHRPVELLDEVLGRLPEVEDPVAIDRIATACLHADRLPACRESLSSVVRDVRPQRPSPLTVNARLLLSIDDWFTGRWDDAVTHIEEGGGRCHGQGGAPFGDCLQGYVRSLVLSARGWHDEALESADRMAEGATAHGLHLAAAAAGHVRALSASSRGDFEEAFGHASTIGPPGDLSRDTPQVLWVLLDLVESAMRTGRRAAASAHVAAIRSASVESISPRLALVSTGCAALTAAGDEARGLFEQAVSTPGAERWPFDLGRVLLAYGEHLRRSRASEEAHGHLVAAVDLFERLGARPWASRAAEQVRAMGRTTAHAAVPATEVLTPQELHIAQLAASGLTNRQIAERLFVSHRTIGAHLYRIYPKLGVTSRAALRDALSSRT